ncbi:unnamed protein product [Sphagnum jensenii]|uniref:Baseplate protein J-like domain-containing protein n=1 Tax=Sphagnum jensenii TaxID=128206 RepID=A0ABP0V6D9_9BRYO
MPGIIQTFDSASLTVTVDIPIPDKVRLNDKLQDVQPVTLLDVPLVLPHTANFALTMAPQAGDECLLIFADYCINTWWEKGADKVSDQYTSSPQPVIRRHDMSDGFAILAPWSQPKAKTLANYSSNQAQLRTTDGTIYVGVGSSGISLNGELTLSGEPAYGAGTSNFYYDLNAVMQLIATRLKMFEGEWWVDLSDGLPLFQQILAPGMGRNPEAVTLLIQQRIIETPNVNSIQNIQTVYNGTLGSFLFSCQVVTDFGNVAVNFQPDINAYELAAFQNVYGQIVTTDNSNSDVQFIANLSLLINDAFNAAQLVYNARSFGTAIGADLDGIVQNIGITRKLASYSTANLTLTGTPLTVIPTGVAQDANGYLWSIPASTTIGNSGTVNVTATCQTIGAIAAPPNTIVVINQGTAGWLGVTNSAAAATGQPVEQDSQLRARASISTAIRSKTLVASTLAAIAETLNVTRYNPGTATPGGPGTSVENPTGVTDSWGNPEHSISMVVEGGTDLAIATAIYNNKTQGTFTNGTTTVAVTDPNTQAVSNISFFRPSYVPIYVTLTVQGLTGFTSASTSAIITAVFNYLQGLQIGELLTISGLYAAAMAVMPNILVPQFSIKAIYAGTSVSPTSSTDISVNFNQVVEGVLANIVVNTD